MASVLCRVIVVLVVAALQAVAASSVCSDLKQLSLPDIRITSAVSSEGESQDGFKPPPKGVPFNLGEASTEPAHVPHCRVEGVIGDEIAFELLLPNDWNGKFLMGGGGGFVGNLASAGRFSVNCGYATVVTDTGHRDNGVRAGWAHNHPERQVNYGYLAVHRTAEAAKAIVRAHYGSAARYSYFYGCSNGGRQAMMEAQRYPEDFDGVVAGAPAHDLTGVVAAFAYNAQRIFPDPDDLTEPLITPDNRRLLQSAILEQCDKLDGVQDGILNDPRDCPFQLSSLPLCPDAKPAPHCLTVAQREAIRAVYEGPHNQDGRIYPGLPFGGEFEKPAWEGWVTGPNEALKEFGEPSAHYAFSTQAFKYLILEDPAWDYSTYDFSTFRKDSERAASFLDATNTDLSGLRAAGGKLILWHGWVDSALTALASIDYYEAAKAQDPKVEDYFRFYLMPGVFHCVGGPGPDRADWLGAIEDWVERGKAPGQLTAFHVNENKQVDMTRPLCVYPERAAYSGSGDTNNAENFSCRSQ